MALNPTKVMLIVSSLISLISLDSANAGLIKSDLNPAKCLHKREGGWRNGNPVHLWDCNAGGNEMKTWRFEASSGLIRSAVNPAKCLHKREGGWRNGNPVHLWDCNAGGNEMKTWRFEASSGLIRSAVNPAKCLHKREGGWRNGNPVHLWDCNAGGNEMKTWRLTLDTKPQVPPFRSIGGGNPNKNASGCSEEGSSCMIHPSECFGRGTDWMVPGTIQCRSGQAVCVASKGQDYCTICGGKCGGCKGHNCSSSNLCAPGAVCGTINPRRNSCRSTTVPEVITTRCTPINGFCWLPSEVGNESLICAEAQ